MAGRLWTVVSVLFAAVGCGSVELVETTASLRAALKVAQCRALCIDEFVAPNSESAATDSDCVERRDCYMCWDSCQYLGSNFESWKDICQQPHICLEGCQLACSYYENEPDLRKENIVRPGLTIAESTASWNSSSVTETSTVVWILLIRESSEGDWKEIAQTVDSHASIKYLYVTKTTKFRVTGVSGGRVVADEIAAATDTEIDEDFAKERGETWPLFLLSMSANEERNSVDVIVTWEPRESKSDYLVTWDVSQDGFGVKGHLYTDTNMVTLSLWPDSVYEVQVDVDGTKSAPLLVDTHSLEADNNDAGAGPGDEPGARDDATASSPSAASGDGGTSLTDRWELAIGVGAGVALFAVLLAAVVVIRRYRARRDDAFKETRFHDSLEYSPNAFVARRIFVPAISAASAGTPAQQSTMSTMPKQDPHRAALANERNLGCPMRKSALTLDFGGFVSSSTTSLSSSDYEDGGLLRANPSTFSCLGSYASCHQIDTCHGPVILNVADLQSGVECSMPFTVTVASNAGTLNRPNNAMYPFQ